MRKLPAITVTILICALLVLAAQAQSTSAQESRSGSESLIISVMNCPDDYQGDNYAADCTEPASGIGFTVGTPNTGNTETTQSRGDGLATFSLIPYDLDPTGPDQVIVGEPATQTSDYAVSCTKNGKEALDYSTETIDFEPGGPLLGIRFSFDRGDDIGCNWYRIHRPMPGQPTNTNQTGSQIGQLPTTGAGTASAERTNSPNLVQLAILLGLAGTAAIGLRPRHRQERSSSQ